jgi:hypothetical protein
MDRPLRLGKSALPRRRGKSALPRKLGKGVLAQARSKNPMPQASIRGRCGALSVRVIGQGRWLQGRAFIPLAVAVADDRGVAGNDRVGIAAPFFQLALGCWAQACLALGCARTSVPPNATNV